MKIVSDKGSQFTSGDNVMEETPASYSWDMKEVGACSGMEWIFVPIGCQYRNGLLEQRVGAVKAALNIVLSSTIIGGQATVNYAQLCSVLARVATVTNDRTIAESKSVDSGLEFYCSC